MYSGSGKKGRGGGGGGRGGGRRSQAAFPPPTTKRSSTSCSGQSSNSRVSSRGRHGVSTLADTSVATEEKFSLVHGTSSVFASIIRLAPDLVDEIKRVEMQGGTARIKFDSNASNPVGNVIEVGGKIFRFTWSHESGGLCDIYEERRSGEDGGGLLVESGCAWRKLNVQRILDESTKNHVKMRSEEAERKMKSRKAIILEHGNPSMKSQMKAMAAVEVNPWKAGFKQWKEPSFKKRKVEQNQAGVFPKPHKKSVSSLLPTTKQRSSPPPVSPRNHSGGFTSPSGTGVLHKGQAVADAVIVSVSPVQNNSTNLGKNTSGISSGAATSAAGREKTERKGKVLNASIDLQSMLIKLLLENPKGMSLKALEKAVGYSIPKSVGKIEHVIKKIATFQAPGRYLLRQGIEIENAKIHTEKNGSSPEDHRRHHTHVEDNHCGGAAVIAPNPTESSSAIDETASKQVVSEDKRAAIQPADNLDGSVHISPENKPSDRHNAGSSSDSGSDTDSESESSDGGSGSGSHSRSRSHGGSGTESSSDSGAPSDGKEVSDEDVEIMTSDDDKVPRPNLQQIPTLSDYHGPEIVQTSHHNVPPTLVFADDTEKNQNNSHRFKPAAVSEHSTGKACENVDNRCTNNQNQYPSQGHRDRFEAQDKGGCADERKAPRKAYSGGEEQVMVRREFPQTRSPPKRKTSPEISKPKNNIVWRKGTQFGPGEAKVCAEIAPEGVGGGQRKVCGETKSSSTIHYPKESMTQRVGVAEAVVSGMADSDRSWPFSKYEKKAPAMKIEIRDLHQYSDYVAEYEEKYESYRSVITILESYRDEFTKLGEELEMYRHRDTDRFHSVLKKMNASFRQSEVRHKRLKKLLLVLHYELKSLKERMKDFADGYS